MGKQELPKPLPKTSKAVMQQVGWLGQTGRFYPWGTPITEIHRYETASYEPVYHQIGEWELNPETYQHQIEYGD